MIVRPIKPRDRDEWLRMRVALWPGDDAGHERDVGRFFSNQSKEPQAVLVAEEDGKALIGFAELSIRTYAEGCDTDHVGYLEGWYVDPDHREQGVGRKLVAASEDWARHQGCTEFASDAQVDNEVSIRAHRACGFEDAGVVRCFRKTL